MDSSARAHGSAIVLTVDRLDPTGAAGLQADALTAACLGCHPLSIPSAIAVEDTAGIVRIDALSADAMAEQLRVLLADLRPDAVRIGYLADAAQVESLVECLAAANAPVVLAAPFPQLGAEAIAAIRVRLLPITALVVSDAEGLLALHATDDDTPRDVGTALDRTFALGCPHVLLTGSDAVADRMTATLHDVEGIMDDEERPRLPRAFAGARDTLACATAAMLANGMGLVDACRDAGEFTWQALAHARAPGRGRALPDRFFWARHPLPQATPAAA